MITKYDRIDKVTQDRVKRRKSLIRETYERKKRQLTANVNKNVQPFFTS